jgi:hypothetical protein
MRLRKQTCVNFSPWSHADPSRLCATRVKLGIEPAFTNVSNQNRGHPVEQQRDPEATVNTETVGPKTLTSAARAGT